MSLCIWKEVADNDHEKRRQSDPHRTFHEDADCTDCLGYETDCPFYIPGQFPTQARTGLERFRERYPTYGKMRPFVDGWCDYGTD